MQAATTTIAATTTATTGDYKELFIANSPNSGDCRWHCQRRCRRRSCLSFKMQGLARLGLARLGLERLGTWNVEHRTSASGAERAERICVVCGTCAPLPSSLYDESDGAVAAGSRQAAAPLQTPLGCNVRARALARECFSCYVLPCSKEKHSKGYTSAKRVSAFIDG